MTQAIDRPGTFRGKALDWGVSETKKGYPQLVLNVQALEYYDEDAGTYIPWGEYDQTMTAYLVLYTKKDEKWDELLNAKQVKKVFGWDGRTFESLAEGKYGETIFLFRVEDSEYNGTTSLKIQWIDTADANPVKTLPKYDTEKLKGLTAKFGGILGSAATPPIPATAPTKKSGKPATPPKAGKKGLPTAGPVVPPAEAPAALPPAPSMATPPPVGAPVIVPPAPSTPPVEVLTKELAWAAVNGTTKAVTDEVLATVWVEEGSKIGKAEEAFTSADWRIVVDAVMNRTAKF
jgi:hypothetical protein